MVLTLTVVEDGQKKTYTTAAQALPSCPRDPIQMQQRLTEMQALLLHFFPPHGGKDADT